MMRRGKRKMAECGLLLMSISFPGCCESNHEWDSKNKHMYDVCDNAMKTVANNGNDGRGFRKLVKIQLSILFHLEYCYHTCSYF